MPSSDRWQLDLNADAFAFEPWSLQMPLAEIRDRRLVAGWLHEEQAHISEIRRV